MPHENIIFNILGVFWVLLAVWFLLAITLCVLARRNLLQTQSEAWNNFIFRLMNILFYPFQD